MTALEEMKIELDAIGHTLSDRRMSVPTYQRSYAWGDTHVRDLLQDLSTAISEGESEYFLGSIVATAIPGSLEEIVDGQQRLATTTILISAIRDYFAVNGDVQRASDIEREYLLVRDIRSQETIPRLQLNANDNDFFTKRVLARPDSDDRHVLASKDSHKRIDVAARLASEHVKSLAKLGSKPADRLLDLLDFVCKKAKVIWVTVPDHANAFTIFETLNDRGLELAISDLLKNYLFLTSENRIAEVQAQWISAIATLEAVDVESVLVDYIRHLWSSKVGATRERELYGAIKKSITSKQSAVDFSKELSRGAKLYAAMLNTDHDSWKTYGVTARGHMSTINLLQMVQIRPLLLSILDKFVVTEVRKSLRLIVSWGARFLITGAFGGGSLEKHYSDKARDVRAGTIKTAKQLAAAMVGVVPGDAQFEAAFTNATVSKALLSRYYLGVLERQASGEKDPELIPNSNQEEVNLEHVLPQHPGVGWGHVDKDAAKANFNRIGNHALMQVSANSVAGNDAFAKKKPIFAKSKFLLTSSIAKEPRWAVAEIERRQERLAALAVKAWPITV